MSRRSARKAPLDAPTSSTAPDVLPLSNAQPPSNAPPPLSSVPALSNAPPLSGNASGKEISTPSDKPPAVTVKKAVPRGLLDQSGAPLAKNARLPSLLGSARQDLTKGGAQKKTFKPKIPVRPKIKMKAEEVDALSSKSTIKPKRDPRPPPKRKERPATIQMHSIFEDGPMRAAGSTAARPSAPRDGSSSTFSSRGERRTDSIKEESMNISKRIVDDGLPSSVSDLESSDDSDNGGGGDGLLPTKLSSLTRRLESSLKLTGEDSGDEGAGAEASGTGLKRNGRNAKRARPLSPETQYKKDLADKLKYQKQLFETCGDTDLFSFLLPPKLPVMKGNDRKKRDQQPIGKSSAFGAHVMDEFEEGRIGTLKVMKSGRMKLVLGDIEMSVDLSTQMAFSQKLVCFEKSVGGDRPKGQLIDLGDVKKDLVVCTDVEYLLTHMDEKS